MKRLILDCFRSRAKSTVKKYIKETISFTQFQRSKDLNSTLPASIIDLSLYLSRLLEKRQVCAVRTAHAALKWVHGILPFEKNPLDSTLCMNLVEVEKRHRNDPLTEKEPASCGLIQSIIARYAQESASLKDLRLATMCTLCFAGLFRSKELLNIRVCDLKIFTDYLVIHVPTSKTDVFREGQDVFISKSHGFSCPVRLLERYLSLAKIALDSSNEFIFRNIILLKSKGYYVLGKRPVSYTRFKELFKECLSELGHDPQLFSLHSFRAGGATSIVKNFEDIANKERLLKIHGRWKSDTAKDMYIKEDINERLSISKSLGL